MSTFVLYVGCGTPLYGFSPCQWCTCESCGNDLRDGFCSLYNSRNSCVYDPNSNSFDFPPDSCHPPHLTYETYSCDSYGNDFHFGYDCQPQFPLNYESEPGYIENYNSYPYDSSSFPQQYPCCEDCEDLPKADHCQPLRYTVNHPIFNAHNDLLSSRTMLMEQMTTLTSMCEMYGDKHLDTVPATKSDEFIKSSVENLVPNPRESEGENGCDVPACFKTFSNILFDADYEFDSPPICCDDDDDEESSDSLKDNIISALPPCVAVTPNEPVDSLSMEDEHLNTVPATESDEFIKSCVEKLVPNPSESEGKNGYDIPAGFTTFSNVLFDADYDSDSSDDHSLPDEDVPEKIYSNPLFDEAIIPMEIDSIPLMLSLIL
nr:hypothetical protein [Tanacetum cinerariifolium]